ncbi:MAG: hypothetical protein WBA05_08255, partial [Gordonia sp. (in: high G+C Gram-positive bacteria)]
PPQAPTPPPAQAPASPPAAASTTPQAPSRELRSGRERSDSQISVQDLLRRSRAQQSDDE